MTIPLYTIVVDTREQRPYNFVDPVVKKGLLAGDYSIEELENRIAVERKTLNDFVNTVIHNKERFFKELTKLQTYDFACIVVEATLKQILAGKFTSNASPLSVIGLMISCMTKFKIPIILCDSRQYAQVFVERFLYYAFSHIQEHGKKTKNQLGS